MDSSKARKRETFLKFARGAGGLPTSAMVASDPLPEPSGKARRAAQVLVGSLSEANGTRVTRVAALLDTLVSLDRATVAKKRANG